MTDKKCSTKCHTTEKVYNKAYMPNQWKQTIISMKRFGVKVTAEEEKQILDFLVAEHGYVSK
ncbi:MAG: hypothetical protein LBV09_00780 [Deferribacteraceae bacterium]|nr:hypothetical protein [Deferribacteraceae bacterium]